MNLCGCGCGQPTHVIAKSEHAKGLTKGHYRRFLLGHNRRLLGTKWYQFVGTGKARRYVHRARAEQALGKPLPPQAIVHHVDGSLRADAPLVICQDQAYHMLLHVRANILRLGGDPNTQRRCSACRQIKFFSDFGTRHGHAGSAGTCLECLRVRDRRRHARKREREQGISHA